MRSLQFTQNLGILWFSHRWQVAYPLILGKLQYISICHKAEMYLLGIVGIVRPPNNHGLQRGHCEILWGRQCVIHHQKPFQICGFLLCIPYEVIDNSGCFIVDPTFLYIFSYFFIVPDCIIHTCPVLIGAGSVVSTKLAPQWRQYSESAKFLDTKRKM